MGIKNTQDMTFGERLMQARNAAMLSRPQLAKASGIPTKAIEKFEYGTQEPNISRLQTLAQILNVTVEYLMHGNETQEIEENEPVDVHEIEADVVGDEIDQLYQKLSYLDELREAGFQKHWRSAPRLLQEVEEELLTLSLDDLLDLGEERELFPVSQEVIDDFSENGIDEQHAILNILVQRVLNTAYFGLDLHSIRKRDLTDLAHTYDLKGDNSDFWGSKWSGYDTVVNALQELFRPLALKGNSPDFLDEDEYKEREVA